MTILRWQVVVGGGAERDRPPQVELLSHVLEVGFDMGDGVGAELQPQRRIVDGQEVEDRCGCLARVTAAMDAPYRPEPAGAEKPAAEPTAMTRPAVPVPLLRQPAGPLP
ncbi:hypothetical protein [Nonomuraea sp. 10N515B]|uniref:hypothetical protein n=1 Tax=Nonomuraea sp. 10N515B TaxID=3457422 RepID=UPI003FCEBF67